MIPRRFFSVWLMGGFLICALVGCKSGPPRGQVTGTVTFKGKPVREGTVHFFNAKTGIGAQAKLESDGGYTITTVEGGLLLGEYKVTIEPPMQLVDLEPGKTPPVEVEKNVPDIPTKYRRQETTPLRATVKQGNNVADFDMTP